jgi:hypothetical protein
VASFCSLLPLQRQDRSGNQSGVVIFKERLQHRQLRTHVSLTQSLGDLGAQRRALILRAVCC